MVLVCYCSMLSEVKYSKIHGLSRKDRIKRKVSYVRKSHGNGQETPQNVPIKPKLGGQLKGSSNYGKGFGITP